MASLRWSLLFLWNLDQLKQFLYRLFYRFIFMKAVTEIDLLKIPVTCVHNDQGTSTRTTCRFELKLRVRILKMSLCWFSNLSQIFIKANYQIYHSEQKFGLKNSNQRFREEVFASIKHSGGTCRFQRKRNCAHLSLENKLRFKLNESQNSD